MRDLLKKDVCETKIRSLCHDWAKERGFDRASGDQPSFTDFKAWLSQKGLSIYLNFRSSVDADYDAEFWFDQELKQLWRR